MLETTIPTLTAILARALDEVDYGIVLARADAHVVHANHPARRALERDHALQLHDGRLVTRDARERTRLHDALTDAALRERRRLLALRPVDAGADACVLAVVPVGDGIAGVVLGKRRVCEDLSIQCFARQHALTAAETRVLGALGSGVAPSDIAEHQGVKLSTVRTQIGAIRDKTGLPSITALIFTVAALPPMVGALRV